MTESQFFLEWVAEAERKSEVKSVRTWLLRLLTSRFPGALPAEVRELIEKQDSLQVLDDWYETALTAFSMDSFRAHVMR